MCMYQFPPTALNVLVDMSRDVMLMFTASRHVTALKMFSSLHARLNICSSKTSESCAQGTALFNIALWYTHICNLRARQRKTIPLPEGSY